MSHGKQRPEEKKMAWSQTLRSLLAAGMLCTLGATLGLLATPLLGQGAWDEPAEPQAQAAATSSFAALERRTDIQQLIYARATLGTDPATARALLLAHFEQAEADDVRQRAAALLLDSLELWPPDEQEDTQPLLSTIFVMSPDQALRDRALDLLLLDGTTDLPNDYRGDFLKSLLPAALRVSRHHSLPPSIALAQAVLESGWGRSALARRHGNLFGIKAGSSSRAVTMGSLEHRDGITRSERCQFQAYSGPEQSLAHHARLLSEDRRYAAAREHRDDWRGFLQRLAPRYATDPRYVQRVSWLVERYQLDRWDDLIQRAAQHDARQSAQQA